MDKETRLRLDKNYKRISKFEARFPRVRRVTQHPKIAPWLPVLLATIEVVLGLLLAGLFSVLFAFLWPYIPWPNIPWPDINIPWPNINLPRIPLPDIPWPDLPELPAWLKETLYWIKKTWPIWIALGFGIYEVRKNKKNKN